MADEKKKPEAAPAAAAEGMSFRAYAEAKQLPAWKRASALVHLGMDADKVRPIEEIEAALNKLNERV